MSHDILYPKKGYSIAERPLAAIAIGALALVQLVSSTAYLLVREPSTRWSAAAFAELVDGPERHRFKSVTRVVGAGNAGLSRGSGAVDRKRDITLNRVVTRVPAGEPSLFRMTTISRGSEVYLKIPPRDRLEAIPGSKSWVHYDFGQMFGGAKDLAARIDEGDIYKDIRERGFTKVRGRRVRTITAVIDLTPFFRVIGEMVAERMGVPVSEADLPARPTPTASMTAYVKEDGELLRLTASVTVEEHGERETSKMTYDVFDPGAPVRIPLPAKADVLRIPMEDLFREGASPGTFQTAAAGFTSLPLPGAVSGVMNMMM